MDNEISIKLKSIFQSVFNLESNEEVEKISRDNHNEWDSLAQLSIIAAVEDEFSTNIQVEEFERFISYEEIYTILKEKGC